MSAPETDRKLAQIIGSENESEIAKHSREALFSIRFTKDEVKRILHINQEIYDNALRSFVLETTPVNTDVHTECDKTHSFNDLVAFVASVESGWPGHQNTRFLVSFLVIFEVLYENLIGEFECEYFGKCKQFLSDDLTSLLLQGDFGTREANEHYQELLDCICCRTLQVESLESLRIDFSGFRFLVIQFIEVLFRLERACIVSVRTRGA